MEEWFFNRLRSINRRSDEIGQALGGPATVVS
jgi:hypothetical protein